MLYIIYLSASVFLAIDVNIGQLIDKLLELRNNKFFPDDFGNETEIVRDQPIR